MGKFHAEVGVAIQSQNIEREAEQQSRPGQGHNVKNAAEQMNKLQAKLNPIDQGGERGVRGTNLTLYWILYPYQRMTIMMNKCYQIIMKNGGARQLKPGKSLQRGARQPNRYREQSIYISKIKLRK